MAGIIYKATNIINGKSYIGQTSRSFKIRKQHHLHRGKIGGGYCFHSAIRKHGSESFSWEILCECNTKEKLDKKELYYIKKYNTQSPYGYNLTNGGEGTLGYIPSIETRKKMSDSAKKRIGESATHYGMKHSEESKQKMRDSLKGRVPWNKGKKLKPLTEEQKKKIGDALRGKKRCLKWLV